MTAGKEVWVSAQGPTGADVQIMLGDTVIQRVIDAEIVMHKDDMNRLTITLLGTIADMKAVIMLPIQLQCPMCDESLAHDCREFQRDQSSSGAGAVPRTGTSP